MELTPENKIEEKKKNNSYEIIKSVGKTKKGEILLVSYDLDNSGKKKKLFAKKNRSKF